VLKKDLSRQTKTVGRTWSQFSLGGRVRPARVHLELLLAEREDEGVGAAGADGRWLA